jgi:uncharacterized membrane protein
MWGPGWEGSPMWGFWWIFPLIGFAVCLAFLVMLFRFITTGHGFACMSGHGGINKETAEMRRELQTLREEVNQLKATR